MPTEEPYVPPTEEGDVHVDTGKDASTRTAKDLASKAPANPRDLLIASVDKMLDESGHKLGEDEGEPNPPVIPDGTEKPKPKKAEPKPEGEEAPKSPDAPAETLEGIPKLRSVLRAREEAQRLRESAQGERETILKELAGQRAQAQQEMAAIQQMKAETEAERQKLARLRANPMEAIKELGWDPKDLVQNVIREGTPEWQALTRQQGIIEKLEARLNAYETGQSPQQKAQRDAYERHQQQQARTNVVQQFLGLVPQESALRTLYDEAEIVARADRVADSAREKGYVATFAEIRDYLESDAEERLSKRAAHVPGQTSGTNGQAAAKTKAGSGQRTLSSSASSERRAAPKPFSELKTEKERHQALVEAAKEATRT